MNPIHQHAAGLAAVLALTLTACSADPDDAGTTSPTPGSATTQPEPAGDASTSSTVDPVTLRIGTGDAEDAPSARQIRWFAHRLEELTGGAMTLDPVYLAAGHRDRFEPLVVRQLLDGDLDLAVVASRAWDGVGVRTLAPLQAPFLVTSDALLARVVDGPIGDQLLAGLPEAGVLGLALWPEGLRHPFGFEEPLDDPGDFAGALIRSPYSRASRALFRTLGARTTDAAPDPDTQRGAESQYSAAPAGTATGNITFFPKVNVLVAHGALASSLSQEQRDALAQAANDTRTWVLEDGPTDDEAARKFCAEGGDITGAGPEQRRAMVRATRPAYAALARDPVAGPIVRSIARVAERVEADPPVTTCGQADQSLAALDGDYVFTVTAAAGRRAGVTEREVLDGGSGRYTVHLENGTWTLEQEYTHGPDRGTRDRSVGDYTFDGRTFTWYWSHEPGANVMMGVRVLPDGSLAFSHVASAEGGDWPKMATVHFRLWKRQG
jgi:TRAP-type C4-dicarboxylate transport system substrate-binding protein